MFLAMGNHLEPFSKVSDPPEGQEQGGGAVRGQERHQGVKLGQKHWSRSQIQVSRRLRTKFTISLLEVILGLLQPLHLVLDLQVGVRLLKMVPNDFPWPKTWGF